jgi:hypothetical protein
MTPEEFQRSYPLLMGWIQQTLRAHANEARPVASFGFARLPRYFSEALLASARVVLACRQ